MWLPFRQSHQKACQVSQAFQTPKLQLRLWLTLTDGLRPLYRQETWTSVEIATSIVISIVVDRRLKTLGGLGFVWLFRQPLLPPR